MSDPRPGDQPPTDGEVELRRAGAEPRRANAKLRSADVGRGATERATTRDRAEPNRPPGREGGEDATPPLPAARLTAGERWISFSVAIAAVAVLSLAVWLKPDARGFGTHQQLQRIHRSVGGPCGLLVTTGLPCPTCGMTTAFSFTVRGHWISAFIAQPAGLALALATAVAGCAAAYAAVRGRAPRLPWAWMTPYRLFMALLIVLLGGWGWKLLYGFLTGALPVKSSDLWRVAG